MPWHGRGSARDISEAAVETCQRLQRSRTAVMSSSMATWSVATTWLPCSTCSSRSPILRGGGVAEGSRRGVGWGRAPGKLEGALHVQARSGGCSRHAVERRTQALVFGCRPAQPGAPPQPLPCCPFLPCRPLVSAPARPPSRAPTCWRGAAPSPGQLRARAAAASAPPAPPRTCARGAGREQRLQAAAGMQRALAEHARRRPWQTSRRKPRRGSCVSLAAMHRPASNYSARKPRGGRTPPPRS